MAEQMNVPKLRFGEFDTFWDTVPLSKLTTKISDGIHSTPNYDESGDFFFVNGNNLKNGVILLDEKTKRVSAEEAKKHHRQIDQNTILMSINGTIGNLAFYQGEPIMLGKSASYINIDPRTADKLFVSSFLQREATKYYFDTELTGSTIKNLSLKAIKNTPVASPSLPEQQKIASFLSKVDEKVALLTEKKDKLTEYKKGVMQQLFNGSFQEQGGLLTFIPPTLRFKADDGSEFPDWEEKALIELAAQRFSNGVFNDPKRIGKGYRLINVKDMYSGNFIDTSTLSFLDLSEKEFSNNQVKYGDIFFTRSSLVPSGIAYSNVNLSNENDITYDGHLIKFSPKLDIISPYYFANYLRSHSSRKLLISRGKQSTMTTIGQEDIKDIRFLIPSLEEQIKIANFLSAIDQKIDLANSELEKAKEWKKGLLQQMFV